MIYLMRHGLDDENFIGGWSDVDLIEEGIRQVESVGEKLKSSNINIEKIITSDVKRAETTSKIIRDFYPNAEIEVNALFREQNKGVLNGMEKEKAKILYPEYFGFIAVDKTYEGGESLLDLYYRMKKCIDYILSIEDDTLIITHRGVINMIYYIFNNIELDMNKERFNVDHASVHELNKGKRMIRKVF